MALIRWAFDLPPTRIQGLPSWVTDYINKTDTMYEIEATAAAAVSEAQCKAMVQSLLADRFKMVSRLEPREMSVYALTVAKKGPKMREVAPGSSDFAIVNGMLTFRPNPNGPKAGVSMAAFATYLGGVPLVGRPVLDRTGLTGVYAFELNFSTSEGDDRPEMSTALQEQLGLKLEPVRAPIEVLVVDHIERPTAN
jgi:uncharacterized protein (TIGR03435 family)